MGRLDLTLLGLVLPAIAAAGGNGNICETLDSNLPGLVSFPNTTSYVQSTNSYWSARQSELRPACFVTPKTAQDVSKAVKLLTSRNAPFTVKSGGHTGFQGGSNIQDGVTIDLVDLNEIKVHPDRKTVSVGPGNRWVNVSTVLDPLGLAVIGGRASTVGVSGLILGGGISYFSGTHGWACDNVKLFEVVTSSGDIITATPTGRNRDLYWALRGGGGSNFGIVTRFDLRAIEQKGELWASSLIVPGSLNATLVPVIQNYAQNTYRLDQAAHQYFVMMHYPAYGGFIILSDQFHPSAKTIPEPFRPIHAAIPPEAVMLNNTRFSTVTQLTKDIEVPFGTRQNFAVTSVKAGGGAASTRLLLDYVKMWEEFVNRMLVVLNGRAATPVFVIQTVSLPMIEKMQADGGNALGIRPSDGPLFLIQVNWDWADSGLDDVLERESKKLIDEFDRLARQRGLGKGFVYMNYASRLQDVYASYGLESVVRLKLTAAKYDPLGKFKRLWKGYHKL